MRSEGSCTEAISDPGRLTVWPLDPDSLTTPCCSCGEAPTMCRVSHPSPNRAQQCLASQIGRDRVRSGWCGRRLSGQWRKGKRTYQKAAHAACCHDLKCASQDRLF